MRSQSSTSLAFWFFILYLVLAALSILSLLCWLSPCISYLIYDVLVCKCLGPHSCWSSSFTTAILNGTYDVLVCKCLGPHSCWSSSFTTAILNGTCYDVLVRKCLGPHSCWSSFTTAILNGTCISNKYTQ